MPQKSIHYSEASAAYLAARSPEGAINWSGATNNAFAILAYIAEDEKPDLSNQEWEEIYNIYAGSDLSRIAVPINLAADLLDHYGATLPSDLPEELRQLIEKLHKMTSAQKFAVLDAARVFWAAQE